MSMHSVPVSRSKTKSAFVAAEPRTKTKAAIVFYRKAQLKKLAGSKTFYFHAEEKNKRVRDFPDGLCDAGYVFFYSGGRASEIRFNGYYARIQSVKRKHKSEIKGKENSRTEFYYEVKIENRFFFNETLQAEIDPARLLGPYTGVEARRFRQYLPAFTTYKKVMSQNKMYNL